MKRAGKITLALIGGVIALAVVLPDEPIGAQAQAVVAQDPEGHPQAFCAKAGREYRLRIRAATTPRALEQARTAFDAAGEQVRPFYFDSPHGMADCWDARGVLAAEAAVRAQWCTRWDRGVTARYNHARTNRQYDRVDRNNGEWMLPSFWQPMETESCTPSGRQINAFYRAFNRAYPSTPGDDSGNSGGSATGSTCLGHRIRFCVRS